MKNKNEKIIVSKNFDNIFLKKKNQAKKNSQAKDFFTLMRSSYLGSWCWSEFDPQPLTNSKISISFSGYSHVGTALNRGQKIKSQLVGDQYIAFGGGDVYGSFNSCCVEAITRAIRLGELQGYDGIAYCLQEGVAGLGDLLAESFSVAKVNGFGVLVSCGAPFNFPDDDVLFRRLLENKDIDIFSPQLYVTGLEEKNNYSIIDNLTLSRCKAALVPTLVDAHLYNDLIAYCDRKGVMPDGFLLS